jgi:hypothetical protein
MLTKHGSARTFGGDTPEIKRCLNLLAFHTQHGPPRARKSHQNRASNFPAQAPYTAPFWNSNYKWAPNGRREKPARLKVAAAASAAGRQPALPAGCAGPVLLQLLRRRRQVQVGDALPDPQQHQREAKNRKCRVPRGGKRSPDSESVRRELSKSGLPSHAGPQKRDFTGDDSGGRI